MKVQVKRHFSRKSEADERARLIRKGGYKAQVVLRPRRGGKAPYYVVIVWTKGIRT